jgi:hypothetical protein
MEAKVMHHHHRARSWFVLVVPIILFAASPAYSAEDQVETESQAVEPQQGSPISTPLTEEEMALLSIQADGQRQVEEIVQSMQGVTAGPAFEEFQARIVRIKLETYVRFLTAIAEFARARGDEPAALESERIIEQVLHPQPPQAPDAPQSPEKPTTPEGGPR